MNIDELTYKINGCAMRVHSELGLGFQEIIYQRALEIEFTKNHISYLREEPQTLFYKGQPIGKRRSDFIVDDQIIIELKAVSKLQGEHFIQTKNYMSAYGFPFGLLLNFGGKSLEHKKIYANNLKYARKEEI